MMSLEDFEKRCIPWNESTGVYIRPGGVQWSKWLNGFFVHNTGNTDVIFGNDLIEPGSSKSYGGNAFEIYKGRLDFRFMLPTPAPATPINQVTITQKFYTYPE